MTANTFQLCRDITSGIEALQAHFGGHAYDIHSHDDEWLVGVTHQGVQNFYCRGERRQSTPGRIILAGPATAQSYPARYPRFSLDRMTTCPQGELTDLIAHVRPLSRIASDHLPIKTRLRLTPRTAASTT